MDNKDLEIARLREMLLKPIVEFGELQDLHDEIAAKNAEIERLKSDYSALVKAYDLLKLARESDARQHLEN